MRIRCEYYLSLNQKRFLRGLIPLIILLVAVNFSFGSPLFVSEVNQTEDCLLKLIVDLSEKNNCNHVIGEYVVPTYIRSGKFEQVSDLVDESDKISLARLAIRYIELKDSASIDKIARIVESAPESSLVDYIKSELGGAYARAKCIKEAKKVFAERYSKFKKIKEPRKFIQVVAEPNGLIHTLVNSGFNEWAIELLIECQNKAEMLKSDVSAYIEAQAFIAFAYRSLHDREQMRLIGEKLLVLKLPQGLNFSYSLKMMFEVSEILVSAGHFELAEKLFFMIFQKYNAIPNEEKPNSPLTWALAEVIYRKPTILFLGQIEEVVSVLKDSIEFSLEDLYGDMARLNRSIIRFFVISGRYAQGNEIASKLDRLNRCNYFLDTYFQCLGEKYVESLSLDGVKLLEKIKSPYTRIDSFLFAAEQYRDFGDLDKAREILKRLAGVLGELDQYMIPTDPVLDAASLFIKLGKPEEALMLAEKIKITYSRSYIVYEVAQYYVLSHNDSSALALKELVGDPYKALIDSKFAARDLIQGHSKRAIKTFQGAIETVIKDELTAFLVSYIIKDYLNAREKKALEIYQPERDIRVIQEF